MENRNHHHQKGDDMLCRWHRLGELCKILEQKMELVNTVRTVPQHLSSVTTRYVHPTSGSGAYTHTETQTVVNRQQKYEACSSSVCRLRGETRIKLPECWLHTNTALPEWTFASRLTCRPIYILYDSLNFLVISGICRYIFSPDIISSGWLGTKHHSTNSMCIQLVHLLSHSCLGVRLWRRPSLHCPIFLQATTSALRTQTCVCSWTSNGKTHQDSRDSRDRD